MENQFYINKSYRGPALVEGYLKKLKHENSILRFLVKFTKRYFIVDLNEYYFGYTKKKGSSKILKHSLLELHNVDYCPQVLENCDWKFPLVVEISNRKYTLFAESPILHRDFFHTLNACISGKSFSNLKKTDMEPIQKVCFYPNNRVVQDPNLDSMLPQVDDFKIESISQGKTNASVEAAKISFAEIKHQHQTSIKEELKITETPIKALDIEHENAAPMFESDDCIKNDNCDYIKVEKIAHSISLTENSPILKAKHIKTPRSSEIIDRSTVDKIQSLDSKLINTPDGSYSNVREHIEFNNFGILDLISDMEKICLENVEIRPINVIKQKILSTNSKPELNKPQYHTPRPPALKPSSTFSKIKTKRPTIVLRKLNLAERPEMKQEASQLVKPSFNPLGKSKPIYTEKFRKATPKPETDWDTWDN